MAGPFIALGLKGANKIIDKHFDKVPEHVFHPNTYSVKKSKRQRGQEKTRRRIEERRRGSAGGATDSSHAHHSREHSPNESSDDGIESDPERDYPDIPKHSGAPSGQGSPYTASPIYSPIHSQQGPIHSQNVQSPIHTQQSPVHSQQSPIYSQQPQRTRPEYTPPTAAAAQMGDLPPPPRQQYDVPPPRQNPQVAPPMTTQEPHPSTYHHGPPQTSEAPRHPSDGPPSSAGSSGGDRHGYPPIPRPHAVPPPPNGTDFSATHSRRH